MKEEKTLITTHTGEPSQPVRIYYQVIKPKTVLGVFKKLRCVYFEQPLKRWRWTYEHEAKKLRFERSYAKIPKEVKPIVMGEFFWRGDQELLLEVRSFDRAIKAIEFFEKRINSRAGQATKLRVVNRFFAAGEHNVEQLWEPESVQEDSPKAWFEYLEAKFKEKIPEIEEIPLDFYRESALGLSGLKMALTLRRIEASQHFAGNESFSQYDLIEQMTEKLVELLPSARMNQLQGIEEEE